MPSPVRTDQVYPLSLTELAFIVIFLILLLTGWMILKTGEEKDAALIQRDEALARAAALAGAEEALERLENLDLSLRQSKAEILKIFVEKGAGNPNEMLTALVKKSEAEAENHLLKQRVEDLDARLSTLEEIREIVEVAANTAGGTERKSATPKDWDFAKADILAAVEFKRALEQVSGEPIAPHRERETAQGYAEAMRELRARHAEGRSGPELARENQDLRGQMAWMKQRLDARGGRDYPPCWVEPDTGKPRYLLTITIQESGLRVEPAWSPERNADAARLPGIENLAGAGTLSLAAFQARTRLLEADSRKNNCRHYVRLINRAKNLDTFNRYRYAVEEFFYKFEIR